MSKPAVVFIESNTSGTGELFVDRALSLGYQPFLLTCDFSRYAWLTKSAFSIVHIIKCDTQSLAELEHHCTAINQKNQLVGITSSSEYFVGVAAVLARTFNLPGGDPEAVKACRDKAYQRECLKATRLNPKFFLIKNLENLPNAIAHVGLPAVVKPTQGTGSLGVRLCHNHKEVEQHAQTLLTNYDQVLVEQMVIGPEFSVELFNGQVIGITRKMLGSPPYFVEVGHEYPANIEHSVANILSETALTAIRLLNLTWGAVHVEVRHSPDGPKLIEVNPRLAGDLIPELIWYASGIDLITQSLLLVTHQEVHTDLTAERTAAIIFLLPDTSGTLRSVEGLNEIKSLPSVHAVELYKQPSMRVQLEGSFRDRIGHVLFSADSKLEARDTFAQITKAIKISVKPFLDQTPALIH
jgi:argininosuccinate lyase